MAERTIHVDALPAARRAGFREYAEALVSTAGEQLLGLTAFGGWVHGDPFFEEAPARSVAVFRHIDLALLDRFATQGGRFGKLNVAAPLSMTPAYIIASGDVFPLELLEIRQLGKLIWGESFFGGIEVSPHDVRLQCERELKSELIQLRQGLLSAAGRHERLPTLALAATERLARVLRGVLTIAGRQVPALTAAVLEQAEGVTGQRFPALRQVAAREGTLEFPAFERVYQEIAALADHVDKLPAA